MYICYMHYLIHYAFNYCLKMVTGNGGLNEQGEHLQSLFLIVILIILLHCWIATELDMSLTLEAYFKLP